MSLAIKAPTPAGKGGFAFRQGYIWGCNDECQCTVAKIDDAFYSSTRGGYYWESVWEGTWHSAATSQEIAEQKAELHFAMIRLNATCDEDDKPWSAKRALMLLHLASYIADLRALLALTSPDVNAAHTHV